MSSLDGTGVVGSATSSSSAAGGYIQLTRRQQDEEDAVVVVHIAATNGHHNNEDSVLVARPGYVPVPRTSDDGPKTDSAPPKFSARCVSCNGGGNSGAFDLQNTSTAEVQWHTMTAEQVLAKLGTSIEGLGSEEVQRRAVLYGKNELTPPRQAPWIVKLVRVMFGGFQTLLWCGAALCLVVFALSMGTQIQSLALSIALVLVVVVTSGFQLYQEGASDKVMAALRAMRPSFALVIRDGGQLRQVPTSDLVPGDIVRLSGGDRIAADMRVIACEDIAANNSSLTGENVEVKLTAAPSAPTMSMYEAKNLARSGCSISTGTGTAVVFAIGDSTFFGGIAKSTTATSRPETLMKHEIRRLVTYMTFVATTLGVAFFILALFHGYTWLEAVIFCIGIIVANVPEGLLPQMTVALTLTAQRMLRVGVLVSNLEVIETLGAVTVICSDKTGTLTCNRMTVVHLVYNWAVSVLIICVYAHTYMNTTKDSSN